MFASLLWARLIWFAIMYYEDVANSSFKIDITVEMQNQEESKVKSHFLLKSTQVLLMMFVVELRRLIFCGAHTVAP
jgi:hypothetical protein